MDTETTDTQIKHYEHEGFNRVSLTNGLIKVELIPELGSKMSKLTKLDSGHQFLLESQLPGKKYLRAEYGDDFEQYDTSGFDECFPTVEPSELIITDNDASLEFDFPDHGELWSRPWQFKQKGDALLFWIDGVEADYRLEKEIRLDDYTVDIRYRLHNNASHKLKYLWSAHPLLEVMPGTELIIEPISNVLINWSSDKSVGEFGDTIDWPNIEFDGKPFDLQKVPPKSLGKTMKLFTGRLAKGIAGLYHPDWEESLVFRFDSDETPFLGLWLCYGGWPTDGREVHYTVGLEPATGRPDALNKAVQRNEFACIEAGSTVEWPLKIQLCDGKYNIDDA